MRKSRIHRGAATQPHVLLLGPRGPTTLVGAAADELRKRGILVTEKTPAEPETVATLLRAADKVELVIADMTTPNINVAFELGLLSGRGVETVILLRSGRPYAAEHLESLAGLGVPGTRFVFVGKGLGKTRHALSVIAEYIALRREFPRGAGGLVKPEGDSA